MSAGQVELTAEKRTVLGKQVKRLRRQGWVPGVLYGPGFDSLPLQFEARALQHALSHAKGGQLFRLKIQGQAQPEVAILHEVQRDPIYGTLLHVDFYRVTAPESISA